MIRIAVDAMGGDHAPAAIVDGAVAAARHLDIQIALVGIPTQVEQALDAHADWRSLPVTIVDAPDVIGMADPPATVRRKPRASICVAAALVARREAGALFSAGHTGATVIATHAALGMIPGVDRPALAATIPTRGRPAVLLDAGANVECRPQHLLQFAIMGGVYARVALGADRPRIGLLSIGEEETKGNELTREAHRLLKAARINFIGNVEGREVYSGVADVIVCDGFTGNVVLKTSEGLVDAVETLLGDELRGTFSSQVGYLLSRRAFRRFRRRVDYSEYGGAPLLGVAGLAIVGHGRSSPKAVRNAIAMAYRFAAGDFIQRVEHEIAAASVSPH
ncbi:MAG TPA: phosphate acyltransferase PlsX [Vicinamibacterales bacterium]|nr:phosphate acyltransferase PlsX [Vicinamibacterales bacterium]